MTTKKLGEVLTHELALINKYYERKFTYWKEGDILLRLEYSGYSQSTWIIMDWKIIELLFL